MSKSRKRSKRLSFQPGKGYRKDVGSQRDPITGQVSYKRFWLGHDPVTAGELARLIVAEWDLIRAHGGQF